MFDNFANNRYVQGPKEFLEGNSIISKLAFLIFVLIMFVILLRIGGEAMGWMFSPSGSPHLLDGMIDAKHLMVYPQDPAIKGSVPILRSSNQTDGLEFTWSVWIYIEDLIYKKDEYKHIFHKGTMDSLLQQSSADGTGSVVPGRSFPNHAPGLYIAPNTNDLVVVMNTFENPNETVIVPDIPLNKWVNVIIRCDDTTLDVYINGTIIKRHQLSGVPRQELRRRVRGRQRRLLRLYIEPLVPQLRPRDKRHRVNRRQWTKPPYEGTGHATIRALLPLAPLVLHRNRRRVFPHVVQGRRDAEDRRVKARGLRATLVPLARKRYHIIIFWTII